MIFRKAGKFKKIEIGSILNPAQQNVNDIINKCWVLCNRFLFESMVANTHGYPNISSDLEQSFGHPVFLFLTYF